MLSDGTATDWNAADFDARKAYPDLLVKIIMKAADSGEGKSHRQSLRPCRSEPDHARSRFLQLRDTAN